MVAVKEPEEIENKTEEATVEPSRKQVVEAVLIESTKPVPEKNNTKMLTIAIVSAAVLFFVGLGLGYCIGHMTTTRRMPMNGMQFPSDNDGERRFYPNSSTQNGTNNGSSSTTTPQTQTN